MDIIIALRTQAVHSRMSTGTPLGPFECLIQKKNQTRLFYHHIYRVIVLTMSTRHSRQLH